ncbi:MAG: alpha/beta hydrolase [Terracidiphilus sp.]
MNQEENDQEFPRKMDPQTRGFLRALHVGEGPPLHEFSIAQARALMRDMQTADVSGYPVDEQVIDVQGYSLQIVRPRNVTEPLPAVMFFHGGGWVLGEMKTHARLVRKIALGVNAAVVFVSYTRAPEAHYPTPVEQCYAATQYVYDHAVALDIQPLQLAVAGDSSGGNLAAAVALLAARRGEFALRLQVLLCPVLDCDFNTASYDAFGQGFNLDRETMRWFWNHYAPDAATRLEPLASPLRAASSELSRLPAALIVTSEYDVLRDEGEAYARRLSDAGVLVTCVRFPGTVHGFVMTDALASTPGAIDCLGLVIDSLQRAFQETSE